MDLDLLIEQLIKLRDQGAKEVFVIDSSTDQVLGIFDVGLDKDGDVSILVG